MWEFIEKNFLHNIANSIAFIGIIIAIVAILVPVYLYIIGKKKGLSYEIISVTSLLHKNVTGDQNFRQEVTINFRGEVIEENVSLVLMKIINTGNVPIKKDDFEEDIKVLIDGEVLTYSIKETKPSDLNVSVDHTPGPNTTVFIKKLLLNKKDELTLNLLVKSYNSLKVSTRIVDVSKIVDITNKRKNTINILSISVNVITLITSILAIFYKFYKN